MISQQHRENTVHACRDFTLLPDQQQQQQQQQEEQAAAAPAPATTNSRTMARITSETILSEGPYVWSVVQDTITSERRIAGGQRRPVKLPLVVTVPMAAAAGSTAPMGPFPVCVLFNGFQARASYYSSLARRLASWGLVVVQYNAPALTIIPDAQEMPFLGSTVGWLKQAVASEVAQPALQGRADLNQLVVAGHSRGGKLAALHFSQGSVAELPIRAAFLIDPVDNTKQTPEGPAYPSATKALRAAAKPFGMAAAGLISASNPEGSNWKLFDAAAAPGSWLMLLKKAGHTTFMKPASSVETFLLDKVFGGGPANREVVVSQTAAAMLAYFDQELRRIKTDALAAAAGSAHDGSGSGLHAVAAAVPRSLASAALPAAAAAVSTAAAGEDAEEASVDAWLEQGSIGGRLGHKVRAAFLDWVVSPLVAEDITFRVKSD